MGHLVPGLADQRASRFLIPSSWEVHKLRGLSAGEAAEGQRGQVSCQATKLNQDFSD